MVIEIPKSSDSKEIAKIHLQAFKSFFLSTLGSEFLTVYYRSCIKSNAAVILCSRDPGSNKIIAFAAGSIFSEGFHKKLLLSNLLTFSLIALKLMITKPHALIRLAKNLDKNGNSVIMNNKSELLSIAVLPEFQGKGISAELLNKFEDDIRQKGSKCLTLTTDCLQNEHAVEFYNKCGYSVLEQFTAYPDRPMFRLYKVFDEEII